MLVNLELIEKYLKRIPDIDARVIDDFINATKRELHTRYMERPKDINGHYIYINDELKDREGKSFRVSSIELANDGSWLIYGAQVLGYEYASQCRHYIKSTVEDVLEDFMDECSELESAEDKDDIIKKYSKKLQLKDK